MPIIVTEEDDTDWSGAAQTAVIAVQSVAIDTIVKPYYSPRDMSIEAIIGGWLSEILENGSRRTYERYGKIITAFRYVLQQYGRDLIYDSPHFKAEVADYAQVFSRTRSSKSRRPGAMAPASRANRLAAISSFYKYCLRMDHLSANIGNPIDLVKRPKVEAYESARPLSAQEVRARLGAIDPTTAAGLRDFALLSVLLETGARASEVAGLRRADIEIDNGQIVLTMRIKGGGTRRDTLSVEVSAIFAAWVKRRYNGRFMRMKDDTPVWVDVRHPTKQNTPLGYQGIRGVVKSYLGTGRVHTTRHTCAVLMEECGAKLTEIQHLLKHKNPATTGLYLDQMRKDRNPHAAALAAAMGLTLNPKIALSQK